MPDTSRVRCAALRDRIMTAEEAAALIPPHVTVGMSGFTGAGYPKVVPRALASRIMDANLRGENFKIKVWTGASTAPELDGALAMVDGIELRLPYQSDPTCRQKINAGQMEYLDMHLSHVAQMVWEGFLGRLDYAVVEVTSILEDGRLVPTSSLGNNRTWIDYADKVILEVNSWQSEGLEGIHDIHYGNTLPPRRQPIPIIHPGDRIGQPYLSCPPEKIAAIVVTNCPDRANTFSPPNDASRRIAGHILEFLDYEVKKGRLPKNLLPIQSGVGNIANAVLGGLLDSPLEGLTSYTEVIQDGMLDLMKAGKLEVASATAFSLSPDKIAELYRDIDFYRNKCILRTQGTSNHPEVIRRLGVLAMNAMIECDIYGNVNSTHIMGTKIMNGIGGSGDFARNAYISFFMSPSTAKGGLISSIVPMVSHTDHTEHDVHVLVTEQGLADLRGLSPKQRAKQVIERCVHPDYRPALREYFHRAIEMSPGKQTPHLLEEVYTWHTRFLNTGKMLP
ncbi:MAG: coenzyme transferase [Chloroflexota bacterium]|jgi:succinyl-CoA:acetate CoA-transferase